MKEALRRTDEVLERVGLLPKRLFNPSNLSLQDKKMLEVAKCIATDPRLILLDEVMAGLTLAETQAPLAVVRDLNAKGATIVMIEHVMPVIMRAAHRMIVLNFGAKIAEGNAAGHIEEPGRDRDAYFGDSFTSMLEI